MDNKSSVEKIGAKTGLIASLINNVRTIVVALVAIAAIVITVASGDGRSSSRSLNSAETYDGPLSDNSRGR